MIPNLVSEIRNSSGYWRVLFRPTKYFEKKFDLSKLKELLSKHAVHIRGWPFPYFGANGLKGHGGYVDCEAKITTFFQRIEYFRFYQSGQFIYFCTLREDQPDIRRRFQQTIPKAAADTIKIKQSEWKGLDVINTLWCLTEFFEFARRLSTDGVFDPVVEAKISLYGSLERQLYNSDPARSDLLHEYKCNDALVELEEEYTIADLQGKSGGIAVEWTSRLFQLFDYDNFPRSILEEEQRKFLERRF